MGGDLGTWTTILLDVLISASTVLILSFGLFLVYGLFRVVNMAHGELVMIGAYTAALAQRAGMGFFFCVLAAGCVSALVTLLMDFICVSRLRRQSTLFPLLATWGFSLVISQGVKLIFGSGGMYVDSPISSQVQIMGSQFATYQLALLAVAIVLVSCTWLVMAKSRFGLQIRATIDDPRLAELQGINTARLFSIVFALGGAFAGMSGALLAPISAINPNAGSDFSITSFMVLISGGLGHIGSAVFGSLVVGGLRSILGTFGSLTLATLGMLLVVALILVVRRRDEDLA
jgi:urea transport system permease protein